MTTYRERHLALEKEAKAQAKAEKDKQASKTTAKKK